MKVQSIVINDCIYNEEKMLCHVAMVENFWMTTNRKHQGCIS